MTSEHTPWQNTLRDGLWRQNPGLVQVLGLCPILAVSTTMINAVSLGLATLLVMVITNVVVAAVRRWIAPQVRIPVFILLIATLVTMLELMFHAWLYGLYQVLGIFIALITTNCIVLARVETFAAKNTPREAALDALAMGAGLVWVLAVLGALRELIGAGTVLGGIDLLFANATPWQLLGEDYAGFLFAILPPGAFVLLGLMVAAFNAINARSARRKASALPAAEASAMQTAST